MIQTFVTTGAANSLNGLRAAMSGLLQRTARRAGVEINADSLSIHTIGDDITIALSPVKRDDIAPAEFERGVDFMFVYVALPDSGEAARIPAGFYTIRVSVDSPIVSEEVEARAEYVGLDGLVVAEFPATLSFTPIDGIPPIPLGGVECDADSSVGVDEDGNENVRFIAWWCGDAGCTIVTTRVTL